MRSRLALLVALLALAGTASAEVPSLDLRGFDPPADPKGGLAYEPATSPDTLDFNVALWTSYSYRPVTLRDPLSGDVGFTVLKHRVAGNLVAGIGLFERALVGLDLPYLIYQTGDDPVPAATNVLGDYHLPTSALGDLKLLGKVTLIKPTNAEFGGFALALHERFGIPTGNQQSYMGEGHVTSETRLLAEYGLLAFSFHAAAGFEVRAQEERYGCAALEPTSPDGPPPSCRTTFGHQVPWSLSLVFKPQSVGLDDTGNAAWFVEAFGYLPASPETPFTNASVSQAQIAAGARFALPEDLMVLAAVDAAMIGGIGNPPVRAHLALSWAPRTHDQDGDGIPDHLDLCPEDLKEDHDGFEDEDGCPDWDNDDDGVPDASDQCSEEPEDEDGFEDDDGCPDPDNDGDGILDIDDACPDVAGPPHADPKKRGCPELDPDGDGVIGAADACPDRPEDLDGFEDDDGCPDPDNDGDGVPDEEDACRDEAGVRYGQGSEDEGCPDGDGDGVPNRKDACPQEAGVASDDPEKHGCPAS
jgi:OmpA-OmpF porin, OOP family